MHSIQPAPTLRQKKGIKKLWVKIRDSMRSGSSRSQPSTTTTTPASNTSASQPMQTAVLGAAVTEPPAQPVFAQDSEPSTGIKTPAAQPQPAHVEGLEPTKADPQLPTQAASAPVQTSDPTAPVEEAIAQPEPANEPETAAPWVHLPIECEVIEVDENEDEEEPTQLPQRDFTAGSAEDRVRYDRAQAIFQKYNMTLDPANWHAPSRSNTERVHKRKRQRVHWTCHECTSTFGREKICRNCSHLRCSICVRYPPKKVGEKAQQRSKTNPAPESAPAAEVLTTGACHECKTEFSIGAPTCKNCDHQICERCLQETVIASPATAPPTARTGNAAAAS